MLIHPMGEEDIRMCTEKKGNEYSIHGTLPDGFRQA